MKKPALAGFFMFIYLNLNYGVTGGIRTHGLPLSSRRESIA
jgi:hypothetical protein